MVSLGLQRHTRHIFLWGSILILSICLQAQQQPESTGVVQLSVLNPPPELPAGRNVVSVSRISGHTVATAASCENGAELGRHVRPGEGRSGIEITSPILSSKGPFSLPQAAGCGYGKVSALVPSGTDQNETFILGAEDEAKPSP